VPTHSSTESAPTPFVSSFDAFDPLVAALDDDIRRAEFTRELLTRFMAAHRDDAFCSHLLRREDAKQSDRAVTDDHDCRAGLDVRCVGGKPAGAHHVGQRQHAGDVVGVGDVTCRDESAVRERHAQSWRAARGPIRRYT
jgi:hypothetical protein